MAKYKVGDVVAPIDLSGYERTINAFGVGVTSEMVQMSGKAFTIARVEQRETRTIYRLDGDDYWIWAEEMLRPVEPLLDENGNRMVCAHCGKPLYVGSTVVDGKAFCSTHCIINHGYNLCPKCGNWHKNSDMVDGPHGDILCKDCEGKYVVVCEHCGKKEYRDETHVVDGDTICRDCYWQLTVTCAWCGERHYISNTTVIYNGDRVCDRCLTQNYVLCPECGQWVENDDFNEEEQQCYMCIDRRLGNIIGGYHERPRQIKFGDCKPQWHGLWRGIGTELEIDRDEDEGSSFDNKKCARAIKDLVGDEVYFNRDGSLNNGFEIITQPHTIKEFYAMPWADILKTCDKNGYSSHDVGTCGLHVHISRTMFGSTQQIQDIAIGKLIKFYDTFYDDILKVSRRRSASAERWAGKYGVVTNAQAKRTSKTSKRGDRYKAVNNTNENTVEIRIMRGTLNYNSFMACIDFILTTALNSRKINWANVNDASKWLQGIKPSTAEYIKSRNAFEGVV